MTAMFLAGLIWLIYSTFSSGVGVAAQSTTIMGNSQASTGIGSTQASTGMGNNQGPTGASPHDTTQSVFMMYQLSPIDMEAARGECKLLKEEIVRSMKSNSQMDRDTILKSADFLARYQQSGPQCQQLDAFSYKTLTSDEAFIWLQNTRGNPASVYNIAKGVSLEVLQIVLNNASKNGWGLHMEPTVKALSEIYLERLGNPKTLTADQIRSFGPAIVYTIATNTIRMLKKEALDAVLEFVTSETTKALEHQQTGNLIEMDPAAVLFSLVMKVERLKSLCSAVWSKYKSIPDQGTFDKTWILIWCAPTPLCRDLKVEIVQNNRAKLIGLPLWKCHSGNAMDPAMGTFFKSFPGIAVCGRYIARKMVEPGPQQLSIDSPASLMNMGMLGVCLPDEYLLQGMDLMECSDLLQGLRQGIFSNQIEQFIARKCLNIPDDLSGVTCTELSTSFGPLLKFVGKSFWTNLPTSALCDTACMDTFNNVDLPTTVKMDIMHQCYRQENTALTSQTVRDLGAMVTLLPIDKLETIPAADLAGAVASIKEGFEDSKQKRTRDSRQKSIVGSIAKKMASNGNIKAISDSEDMMKTISLKDLKSAVSTNIVEDLGVAEHDVVLTDSQNKWVMAKITENQAPSQFTATDLRNIKSLVKGFQSKDIQDMGEAHNESGIDLAVALCEQTNWPLKPLQSINRDLIKGSLMARNSTHPMKAMTMMDVSNIGCECLMHFESKELRAMDTSICAAVCAKVGYCNSFRCLNPVHRKNFLQACLTCQNLGVNLFTEVDMNSFGPNLISQLSGSQLSSLVPTSVLMKQIGTFKDMCMKKDFRQTLASKLVQNYGSSINYDTLSVLGSAVMMFPRDTLQKINSSHIASLVEAYIQEIAPTDETQKKLLDCCMQWLKDNDIEYYEKLKHNLLLTIKDAIVGGGASRKKRKIDIDKVSWTCTDMQLLSEAFTTLSEAEINNMDNTEFIDCLADIGSLTLWNSAQKTHLLAKTENAFGGTVCNLQTADLLNLGVIGEAMTTTQISCLPLDQDDVVASFGANPAWTTDQLKAFATRYMSLRNLTDLSGFMATDIELIGHLLCGFTTAQLAKIPAATIAASGTQLGSLSHCPMPQLIQLKTLATHPSAYGPVSTWTAADVGEQNFVLAGLVGEEIKYLSEAALEGLSSNVIPRIPANTLKEINLTQLKVFTEVQAGSVTAEQRAAMSPAQIAVLDNAVTGERQQQAQPSAGSMQDAQFTYLLLASMLIMMLLSA